MLCAVLVLALAPYLRWSLGWLWGWVGLVLARARQWDNDGAGDGARWERILVLRVLYVLRSDYLPPLARLNAPETA